jgi:zinc-binding alcohol dehydrogenase/oxidoreductase
VNAVVLRAFGEPGQLSHESWPDPVPTRGEVVVRLHAAALNHRDVWIRKGLYAKIKLPAVLGSDGAGTIVAVGRDVEPGLVGSEVVINPSLNWVGAEMPTDGIQILGMPHDGTYAESVTVPAACVFSKPRHLSFEEAAAFPLGGVTAYRGLVTRARLSASERVLVTGIGGGVATLALLFARQLGAEVYVTSGSEAKIERAIAHGARAGVQHSRPAWDKELLALAGGPFDVVVDGAGGETFARALGVLKPGGRLVSYGATLGHAHELEVRRIFWRQLDVLGTSMGSPDDFAGMLALVNQGVHPIVDAVYDLADAPAAHRRMEDREQFGKIVLRIAN